MSDAAAMRSGSRSREGAANASRRATRSGVATLVVTRVLLVYTQQNAASRQLGEGLRARARRPGPLSDCPPRLLIPVLPGSRRRADHRVRDSQPRTDDLLRAARDAGIPLRLPSAVSLRP